ncbi:MAG: hypothetical protein H6742_03485 [Alphaproteobacteria bacterium]|nr:hypothetical protein [Alphaproteobacteria bacterium]
MSRKPSSSPVRILAAGAALTVGLAACKKEPEVTANPPPLPPPTENPPPPPPDELPTWDAVASGHPEGATNPPMPVLVVHESGEPCYKDWFDPRAVPQEARAKGGIVLEAGDAPLEGATRIQCPPEQVAEVLGRHAELKAAGLDPVPPAPEPAVEGGE